MITVTILNVNRSTVRRTVLMNVMSDETCDKHEQLLGGNNSKSSSRKSPLICHELTFLEVFGLEKSNESHLTTYLQLQLQLTSTRVLCSEEILLLFLLGK